MQNKKNIVFTSKPILMSTKSYAVALLFGCCNAMGKEPLVPVFGFLWFQSLAAFGSSFRLLLVPVLGSLFYLLLMEAAGSD